MNEIDHGPEDCDREYFQAVESEFIARRGTPFLLSPKDYGIVQRWRAVGIPLSDVLFGIEEAFRLRSQRGSLGKINSLAYCEGSVLEAWESRASARTGAPGEVAEKREDTAQLLETLVARLEEAAVREEILRLPLEHVMDRLGRLRASGKSEEETEESLARIEKKLLRELAEMLTEKERSRIEEEIAHLLHADAATMESSALKKTARVLFWRRLRERHGLPRLSLLA